MEKEVSNPTADNELEEGAEGAEGEEIQNGLKVRSNLKAGALIIQTGGLGSRGQTDSSGISLSYDFALTTTLVKY